MEHLKIYNYRKLTVYGQSLMLDKNDSPKGYHPVPKEVFLSSDNICNHCDWRKGCNGEISCMSYKRKDGIGVFFKKIK